MKILCSILGVFVLSVFASCADRTLTIKEKSIDFGAEQITIAVKTFSQKGSTPKAYKEFDDSLRALEEHLNLSTRQEADYWRVVLATPLMHKGVVHPFDEQGQILGITVWPTWLGVVPQKGATAKDYFELLCSDKLSSHCRHLVPEVWSAVIAQIAWKNLSENAKEVFDLCLDCDGVHDTKAVAKTINTDFESIKSRVVKVTSKGSPYRWPISYQGLSDFDGQMPQLDCVEQSRCVFVDIEGNKRKVPTDTDRLALHVSSDSTVGSLQKNMSALRAIYGKSTELNLLFRDKDYPYRLKKLKLANKGRLTGGLRIEDQDSLQLWVQAMAAQN